MKLLKIRRLWARPDGTFGTLEDADKNLPLALTLELPYKNNQKDISCIPVGEYTCTYENSPRLKRKCWKVNIATREGILFHPANLASELKGCIALGERWGKYMANLCLVSSRDAIGRFEEYIKEDEKTGFRLVIE